MALRPPPHKGRAEAAGTRPRASLPKNGAGLSGPALRTKESGRLLSLGQRLGAGPLPSGLELGVFGRGDGPRQDHLTLVF